MNIFVVNEDPKLAAQDLCDKHVVKMIVESAQLLSTAMYLRGISGPYKIAHKNHPCVKWVLKSVNNAKWLEQHLKWLLVEYTKRYKKEHATTKAYNDICDKWIITWHNEGDWRAHTSFVQCMPNYCKNDDAVIAYRNYYKIEKSKFAKWKYSNIPTWWQ